MNPLWTRLAQKALIPAAKWLLTRVGLDWVLKRVEDVVDGIGHRQKAILKARSITDGRFGSSIIEERTRWVVYSADEPRAVFPGISGDLVEEMRGYDLSRLRGPEEVSSARGRAWAASRFQTLRDRLRPHEDLNSADTAEEMVDGRTSASSTVPAADRIAEPDITSFANRGDSKADAAERPLVNVEDKLGHKAFDAIIKRMPTLLEKLSACPAKPAAEQSSIRPRRVSIC